MKIVIISVIAKSRAVRSHQNQTVKVRRPINDGNFENEPLRGAVGQQLRRAFEVCASCTSLNDLRQRGIRPDLGGGVAEVPLLLIVLRLPCHRVSC